jgi:uncharacterized membrane protein
MHKIPIGISFDGFFVNYQFVAFTASLVFFSCLSRVPKCMSALKTDTCIGSYLNGCIVHALVEPSINVQGFEWNFDL